MPLLNPSDGQRLAIVLDGNVLTAPRINGQISDNGVIENIGNQTEAADLALNLRAGSLPTYRPPPKRCSTFPKHFHTCRI